MKYIVLIPAYEPDNKLIELLMTIPKNIDVIVVNDGSNNNYNDIFNKAKKNAHILSYENNMGKGYAIKTGLSYIKDNYKNYVVVTMDCDLQHKINDAISLCDYAKEHTDTLVLGKRKWDKTMPIRSRIGNTITRFIFYKKTGLNIYDTQTGLRAFSNKLTNYMLNVKGNRYEYEMNVLLNLKNSDINYYEIPIETIYINNNKNSHFDTIKDSYKIYKEIIKWKKTR